MESFKIRRATPEDVPDISRVRITGWRQSYKGIVPDDLLAKLDIEADQKRVRAAMADPENKAMRFVAEMDGRIIGMGACGSARKGEDDTRGEIYAIYLLNEAKGKGIGTSFMRDMVEQLQANGFTSLQVSVLEKNSAARKFYEKLGGKLAKSGVFQYDGFELPDVTYVWDQIETLMKRPTRSS